MFMYVKRRRVAGHMSGVLSAWYRLERCSHLLRGWLDLSLSQCLLQTESSVASLRHPGSKLPTPVRMPMAPRTWQDVLRRCRVCRSQPRHELVDAWLVFVGFPNQTCAQSCVQGAPESGRTSAAFLDDVQAHGRLCGAFPAENP